MGTPRGESYYSSQQKESQLGYQEPGKVKSLVGLPKSPVPHLQCKGKETQWAPESQQEWQITRQAAPGHKRPSSHTRQRPRLPKARAINLEGPLFFNEVFSW